MKNKNDALPNKTLAIIAGSGSLPIILANEALKQDYSIIIYSVIEENHDNKLFPSHLQNYIQPIHLLKLGKLMKLLEQNKTTDLVMVGKIHKKNLFNILSMDLFTIKLLPSIRHKGDMSLFNIIVQYLNKINITIQPQTLFLQSLLLPEDVYTKRKPSPQEWSDIQYGMFYAKKITDLDIGQTVVIKDGIVVAVEAIESTNECILRGGSLAKKDAIVCKTARTKQNNKFDVPAIGLETIEAMYKSKCKILAIESNTMYAIDITKLIEAANRYQMILVSTAVNEKLLPTL